ncbi:glycosyltransferase family 4 protein [Pseudomonas corrugata]|uniref:glycosyltransferase family 4 protein n=1 Tax=Pseudomonas corrugata TaxID=47879 RepID=UPI0004632625|nr:glycosyltransferase family 4 protein [Pseudomonas corrugata]MDU9021600.1 glycosyltransferase family 4 protein [Pseudomonas corrugata]MDU9039349.1 glycosyltransferase family 4 protein [Pseudomonas corrugata]
MSIINVMWAGGSPFASVHKVHHQILSRMEPSMPVKTWLLQGSGASCQVNVGQAQEWRLSSARLKGRHVWRLFKPLMRKRFRQALLDSNARVVLLDGLGVARTLLPVLETLSQIRVVVIFHGSTRLNAESCELLRRFPASRLALAAVSRTLAASLQDDLELPVTALRSALDPVAFRSALVPCTQARARLGLAAEQRVFGAIGRLVDDKGFACLLEAFALAAKNQPDWRLVIVGEGPRREALQERIAQSDLLGKVLLTGHLYDIAVLYRAFDWVLIPSISEGLGLILQEAVMAGVPVLASELAVFREQLGDTGWYAQVNDVQAWSEALVRISRTSAEEVAAAQHQALAPDEAWLSFSQTARQLISGG